MVRGDWPREPTYRQQWPQERLSTDNSPTETRYMENNEARRPPLNIETALREHCHIPAKHYFVAAVLDDGSQEYFSSFGRYQSYAINKFFSEDAFRRTVKKAETATSPIQDDTAQDFASESYRYPYGNGITQGLPERRRQGSDVFGEEDPGSGPRKRTRGYRRQPNDDETPTVNVGSAKRTLKIGDAKHVWDFYDQRFRNCQQTACKLIAKAWVKVVEPKKQTNHPYTGQDERAPEWWPKPWGTTKEEKVRHKEPDHLYKKERVHLLCHILRMIVEPNEKQHPAIQKMRLDVDKLREATDEALSSFFAGKENEKNAKKKPYLDEIFKVAMQEQRYKHGEIDEDALVYVMSEDRFLENGLSENDDGALVKDEADHHSIPSSNSPSKTMSHDGLLHGTHAPSTEHSPGGQLQSGPYMNDVALRGPPHYPPQIIPPSMHAEPPFVHGSGLHASGGMPLHEMVPSPQESGQRRATMYQPAAEYSNAASASVYSPSWHQQHPNTTAPGTASVYSFQGHAPAASTGHFGAQTNVPVAPGQYLGSQYDSLPRGGFDQNALYRQSSGAPQPQIHEPQGFTPYLPPENRAVPNLSSNPKPSTLNRGGPAPPNQYP